MSTDPRSGYEVAPRRIGDEPGRRRPLRFLAAVVAVLGVSLAVAKPWAAPTPDTPADPAPSVAVSSPAPGSPSVEPSATATELPPQAGVPIARGLVAYAGTWGIGTGGWWEGERIPWTSWTSSVDLYEGLDAGGGERRPPSCERLVELPVGRFVAISAPSRLAADSPITATRYLPDGGAESIPDLVSISRPADEGIAYLFLNDGSVWPAGAHRFVVRTPAGPVSLDACLREGPTSPDLGDAPVPSGILDTGGVERIASLLAERQGAWGVAVGGWRPNGVAWARWQRVAPRRTSSGEAVTLSAPDCGDMDPIASGIVVAVTAPLEIEDPKDVSVLAFSNGQSRVMREIRRLPRGPDRGIVTFFRLDGAVWRSGPYRFVVATPSGPVALDACFLSLGASGGG